MSTPAPVTTTPGSPVPALEGRLADLLAGKSLLMTGVTGFIGEQLLWKILTDLPTTTPYVLVRPKRGRSARDRVVQLVRKPIFDAVREAAGGAEELVDQRIRVVEGDLPAVPVLPRTDIVLHCAGDVSFDPPIDGAFATNVIGTRHLVERMLEANRGADGTLEAVPHYLQVSTAYTAGRRRGAIPEEPHASGVDYVAETDAALHLAREIESRSREPEVLAALRKEAEREHAKAGYLTTSADTERRRQEWVAAELVRAGTERARSLGWTDAYTFAKALAERVVLDLCREVRVSIVRPAIVESSLHAPYPGWIEGYKMAEPIIMAYGKGKMTQFPMSPDSVIDIVPCDYVVNATLAVAATRPAVGEAPIYHVNSGHRNPLTFHGLYELVKEYFAAEPFLGSDGQPIVPPPFEFPNEAGVRRWLGRNRAVVGLGEAALRWAPRSSRTRRWASALDTTSDQLEFVDKYLTIYGEYLKSELDFVDDHTLALHRSLHADDVARWGFDSADVDWHHYIVDVHCPSVTAGVRKRDARKARARTAERADASANLPAVPAVTTHPAPVAVFDLDGTVLDANVVETYLWARMPGANPAERVRELAGLVKRAAFYVGADRTDRGAFLRLFYRNYAGLRVDELQRQVHDHLEQKVRAKLSADALRRIEAHREAGHTTILLTGAIRPLTTALEPYFDVIVAADLEVDAEGVCTGYLTNPPLVGEARAAWLREYARTSGTDLADSWAYADSHADTSMLAAVGHPVAVSPDLGLLRAARQHSWRVVEWDASRRR